MNKRALAPRLLNLSGHLPVRIQQIKKNLLYMTEDRVEEAMPLVTCERCGLAFHPANNDAQAKAEFERDFPGERFDPKEVSVLCDPCYEKFMAWMKGTSLQN